MYDSLPYVCNNITARSSRNATAAFLPVFIAADHDTPCEITLIVRAIVRAILEIHREATAESILDPTGASAEHHAKIRESSRVFLSVRFENFCAPPSEDFHRNTCAPTVPTVRALKYTSESSYTRPDNSYLARARASERVGVPTANRLRIA